MRSGHFEAIWSSLAPLLAKLAYCPEGFLGNVVLCSALQSNMCSSVRCKVSRSGQDTLLLKCGRTRDI